MMSKDTNKAIEKKTYSELNYNSVCVGMVWLRQNAFLQFWMPPHATKQATLTLQTFMKYLFILNTLN